MSTADALFPPLVNDCDRYGQRCTVGFDPASAPMNLIRPTTMADRKARRRAQNRESQKAFRKRKAEQEDQMSQRYSKMADRCERLEDENEHLRQLLSRGQQEGAFQQISSALHGIRGAVEPSGIATSTCDPAPDFDRHSDIALEPDASTMPSSASPHSLSDHSTLEDSRGAEVDKTVTGPRAYAGGDIFTDLDGSNCLGISMVDVATTIAPDKWQRAPASFVDGQLAPMSDCDFEIFQGQFESPSVNGTDGLGGSRPGLATFVLPTSWDDSDTDRWPGVFQNSQAVSAMTHGSNGSTKPDDSGSELLSRRRGCTMPSLTSLEGA